MHIVIEKEKSEFLSCHQEILNIQLLEVLSSTYECIQTFTYSINYQRSDLLLCADNLLKLRDRQNSAGPDFGHLKPVEKGLPQ